MSKNVVTLKSGSKVIGTDTDRSASYDFLLTLHSNHGPISHCFRDRRRFQSNIAKFSHQYFAPLLTGFPLELRNGAGSEKTGMMEPPDGRKSFEIGLAVKT